MINLLLKLSGERTTFQQMVLDQLDIYINKYIKLNESCIPNPQLTLNTKNTFQGKFRPKC